jgi:flagellar biosynthesis/type III secretory pathway protein FliH
VYGNGDSEPITLRCQENHNGPLQVSDRTVNVGQISDVKVYDRALTQQEIESEFDEQAPVGIGGVSRFNQEAAEAVAAANPEIAEEAREIEAACAECGPFNLYANYDVGTCKGQTIRSTVIDFGGEVKNADTVKGVNTIHSEFHDRTSILACAQTLAADCMITVRHDVPQQTRDGAMNANFAAAYGPTGSPCCGSTGPDPDIMAGVKNRAWSEGWDEGWEIGYNAGLAAAKVTAPLDSGLTDEEIHDIYEAGWTHAVEVSYDPAVNPQVARIKALAEECAGNVVAAKSKCESLVLFTCQEDAECFAASCEEAGYGVAAVGEQERQVEESLDEQYAKGFDAGADKGYTQGAKDTLYEIANSVQRAKALLVLAKSQSDG